MYQGALEKTGGAPRFADFLEDELIPYIESHYPGDPSRRCFVGYSLGSSGCASSDQQSRLFQYYLLGSPSLWFNDYYLAARLDAMPADSLAMLKESLRKCSEEESWRC